MASGVELATAYVSLVVEGSKVTPGVKQALGSVEGEAAKTGKKSGNALGSGMSKSFAGHAKNIAAGIGIGFGISKGIGFLKDSNAEAREAQKVGAQTNAVIKSTAGVANVTSKSIGRLSTAISNKVGIDDEAIQSGANMLLTFTNIRNEAGRGNKVFDQTVQAATDMSVAMGTDAKGAALTLGKALNDPVKGLSKLQKQGVTFTDQQKAQITALVKSGKTLEAQKVILKEVNKEFGGSAAAQATAGDKATVAWKNLEEQIGTALLPVVDKFSNLVSSKVVPGVSKFITQMQTGKGAGGDFADELKDIVNTGKSVLSFFNGLPGPVKKFGGEALLAYVALSKLNAVSGGMRLTGFISQLANSETRMDAVGKASYRLGQGLRNAAGVGGVLLLTNGLQKADSKLGTFESTVGGALAGFSVGGPWGALAGGVAGFFSTAFVGTDKAASSLQSYIDTLDQASAKVTQITRKQALRAVTGQTGVEEAGTANANAAGISTRSMVNAITGSIRSFTKIKAEVATAVSKGLLTPGQATKFLAFLKAQRDQLQGNKKSILDNDAATRVFSARIKSLPKKVQTDITTNGMEKTTKAIVGLTAKYHLNPKSVRTLILENGGKPTRALIQSIIDRARALDKQAPKVTVHADTGSARASLNSFSSFLNQLTRPRTVRVNVHRGSTSGLGTIPKAGGGRVLAGQAYTVGEVRRETFVPDSNGRIIANPATQGGGGTLGRLTITNWHQGTGYFETVADSRVASAASLYDETQRAI